MIEDRASSNIGLVLFQAPTHRQRAARRRTAAIAAAVMLAAAGWIAGALMIPGGTSGPAALGPFSYFPS